MRGTVFSLLFILIACSGEQPASTDEVYRQNESGKAATAVSNFRQLLDDYRTSYVTRGAHAKAHACVRAEFDVLSDLGHRYRHGVFQQPGRHYKAWIRFSNGHFDLSVSRDQKKDARGMAIKLLEPPGDPLQVAANGIPTQDFLMTNSPVFFVKNIEDYNALTAEPDNLPGYIFNGFNPFNWRLYTFFVAPKTLTPPPGSLLGVQYFSITAYKLGDLNIKFSARPCRERQMTGTSDSNDPDFLRKNLARELRAGEACFEFMVQEQVVGKGMSIEDPTVEWREEDSPFVPVARITIPAQVFDRPDQRQFCEDLAFAPWHALPAHRPVGQFNRMRRHVYPASSKFRHTENNTEVPEVIDW